MSPRDERKLKGAEVTVDLLIKSHAGNKCELF